MSQAITPTAETEHWDSNWLRSRTELINVQETISTTDPIRREFYHQIGDVTGLRVLDLGCGAGALSVLLAKLNATVTALDTSEAATKATATLADFNGVADRVTTHHGEMSSLLDQQFDLIVGVFVLHHLEPFDAACRELDRLLLPTGRGVFLENNARNPILMFARKYLTGRFGIPKYGDASEYPFQPTELAMLRRAFGSAEASFPQLICFRQLNTYLFRHNPRLRLFSKMNDLIDDAVYKLVPPSRKLSYQQIVCFGPKEPLRK